MAVNLEAGAFYWLLFAFILGLAVGSFLNVVIYRLPIILERNWKKEAHEVLGLKEEVPHARFNLAYPASHCPQCGIKIAFYQNIPLLLLTADRPTDFVDLFETGDWRKDVF
ncbi:MAG: hypothetical protein DI620_02910, partial [Haemophilus parainfluenzae]